MPTDPDKKRKVVITGAAGLVGQNLVTRLKERPDLELVGIDKHPNNCGVFRSIHPEVPLVEADLARAGDWQAHFESADCVVLNHAQIGALTEEPFIANNVTATERVLDAIREHSVPYIVHISSSVVNSQADDFYTRSKGAQEELVLASGVPVCVLRPTLMYGWFDRKHMGWLSHFMRRSPVFPIPGDGKYIRQPLYVGDFCNVIVSCLDTPHTGEIYDISGLEKIFYVDLIKALKDACSARAVVVPIPYRLFWFLLRAYGLFDRDPPFTTKQLEALVIPEEFDIIDWPGIFGVQPTPTRMGLDETFRHPVYSNIQLEF